MSERREVRLESGGANIKVKCWNEKKNLGGPALSIGKKVVLITNVELDDFMNEKCANSTDMTEIEVI